MSTLSQALSISLERQCQELALMTRPRAVFMASRSIVNWVLGFAFCLVFELAVWNGLAKAKAGVSIFGVIVPVGVTIGFAWFITLGIRTEFKKRALVRQGECARGEVILQEWTGRRSKHSEISYEFKDMAGNRYHGTGDDVTYKYFVNSPVLIFYLRADPTKNVAIC
jgi:hypothetical protein